MSQQEPSEAEMRAALEEQMRRITVQDVLIQTVVTLINLGGRRLGLAGPPEEAGERDLEQARLAIEGARALVPLLPQERPRARARRALPAADGLRAAESRRRRNSEQGGRARGGGAGSGRCRRRGGTGQGAFEDLDSAGRVDGFPPPYRDRLPGRGLGGNTLSAR